MEYVRGADAGADLRQARSRCRPIARSTSRSGSAGRSTPAHRAGVIHRDIKPANVILAPDAENGDEPKLIDFGLAKVAARRSAKRS